MNTAAIRVGRLLEIRALAYRNAGDVTALFKAVGAELSKVALTTQIVTVTDWRYCPLLGSEAAEVALAGMTKNNARVLRSGALASHDSPIAVLQFLRLVRESKNESRRLFFDEGELMRWLGEVLTDAENARLLEFLHEPVERQRPTKGSPPR
ncbi:MAG TPA: hypothetical protein VMG12_43695 [Polyangiaceae bacterium]|nr:hypothetical protein [Polyangiaceae bacterium]